MMECGIRWAVEARTKGRRTQREQTAGQEQGKTDEQDVKFA